MKDKRHEKIIELINQYDIETQDELAEHLRNAGFQVTQATVSRDIRKLKLSKVPARDGKQKYADVYKRQLQDRDVSLEESFALYEQGMKLLKKCSENIDHVEKRMLQIDEEGHTHEFS